jgi:RNA polymerase sigma-70 factor (ECF subfamily)
MVMAGTWVEAEFEAIFREHFERMVRIARRVLGSDAEAEEVCAEAFLKLYRAGSGVLAGGAVGAWLYRVASRASIDRLRQSKRHGVEEELDPEAAGGADPDGDDPLKRLMRNERIAEVRRALTQLKPEKSQLLLLRHSGLSYVEIAAAMQIKTASVGTMLARAEAEFSAHYQKQQRLSKGAPRLRTAGHPAKEG